MGQSELEYARRNGIIVAKSGRTLHGLPLHPNAGTRMFYQRKLDDLIKEMHNSYAYWLTAAWRKEDLPEFADDENTVTAMQRVFKGLGRQWEQRFDAIAPQLARKLANTSKDRVDSVLQDVLKRAGFSVQFTMTDAMRNAYNATIAENVGLIKSIPQEFLNRVQGDVLRSVSAGRDLGTLTETLQDKFAVSRKRAALIARDQNNKATSIMGRARQLDAGITQAKWRHSNAGNHPRPTHVAMNGELYDAEKGMWDSAEGDYVFPGMLINCRCISVPVIPGFE